MVRGARGRDGHALQPRRDDRHPLQRRLADGAVGHAYVGGRRRRHAELAAVLDALLQDPARRRRSSSGGRSRRSRARRRRAAARSRRARRRPGSSSSRWCEGKTDARRASPIPSLESQRTFRARARRRGPSGPRRDVGRRPLDAAAPAASGRRRRRAHARRLRDRRCGSTSAVAAEARDWLRSTPARRSSTDPAAAAFALVADPRALAASSTAFDARHRRAPGALGDAHHPGRRPRRGRGRIASRARASPVRRGSPCAGVPDASGTRCATTTRVSRAASTCSSPPARASPRCRARRASSEEG